MELAWKDKVAVISGAASGMGESLARQLAAQGCKLVLCDWHAERLEALRLSLVNQGASVLAKRFDVSSLSAYEDLANEVAQQLGGADLVINNAGVALIEPFQNMSPEDAQWIMGVNFWGVFNGCKSFAPQLLTKKTGVIVNISSIFAMVSMPTQSLYNASKAAVRAFSDSLREEMRAHGVHVLCVHPGGIKTRIVEDARFGDMNLIGQTPAQAKRNFLDNAPTTAESAATQILAAINARKHRLLIGNDAKFLDWMFRLFPATASQRFSLMAKKRRDQANAKDKF